MRKKAYAKELKRLQTELVAVQDWVKATGQRIVIIFEGRDAAGKGGNIKRLTSGLDPRGYDVLPIGAPTGDEKTHHYLWRFWRHLPSDGQMRVFDRTWYGRVLVERVEGAVMLAEEGANVCLTYRSHKAEADAVDDIVQIARSNRVPVIAVARTKLEPA